MLEGERVYCQARSLHAKEQRQLTRLLELQKEGVVIYRRPSFCRIDGSELVVSERRIGVVGLVVDNSTVGLVNQLRAIPHPHWDISINLSFNQVHISALLLKLIDSIGIEDGLPELFSFKIEASLDERCEGDSMDLAGLLAIIDSMNHSKSTLLRATAAVVSPTDGKNLQPSKSISKKLDAFRREYGRGSLLVRYDGDSEAEAFDDMFETVWPVKSVDDLAHRLENAELLDFLHERVSLRSEHALAIAGRTEYLLRNESTYPDARAFINRLKRRIANDTPLRIKLEVSYAEEDLLRHMGCFDEAIEVRNIRKSFEDNPLISSYERMADSDNRLAASLYDAHRFGEAIDCLEPWLEKITNDPRVCLPETRSFLLNTMARCLVVVRDERWERLFLEALRIQREVSPASLHRTENYIAHGLLKQGRFEEVDAVLQTDPGQFDPYRIWINAEKSRQQGLTWGEVEDAIIHNMDPSMHIFGFAIQAAARQRGRPTHQRIKYLQQAQISFMTNVESDKTNIKRILSLFCCLAVAVLKDDNDALNQTLSELDFLTKRPGIEHIGRWYHDAINELRRNRDWNSIEKLFHRVPHF